MSTILTFESTEFDVVDIHNCPAIDTIGRTLLQPELPGI